jgi:isocitrate dehydrogenase
MNGATRDAETWVTTVWDTNYQVAASGDYDGDGKTDLIWRHVGSGAAYVWLMDGAVRVSETCIGTVAVGYVIVR